MPSPHIILDFDGTLIDSSGAILATFAAALRARNITPARPLTRELIGPPLLATLQTLTGISDRTVLEDLAAEFRARYDSEGLLATVAYPGIAEALHQLTAAGSRLMLATNKRQRPTLALLEQFGWRACFDAVYCIDSHAPPYAHKGAMLQALLADFALEPAHCVYVGDTNHDLHAAQHAGLGFVGVAWGYGVGEQALPAGVAVLREPGELLHL